MKKNIDLKDYEIDRVIEMAWEDRTTFDAIKAQFLSLIHISEPTRPY